MDFARANGERIAPDALLRTGRSTIRPPASPRIALPSWPGAEDGSQSGANTSPLPRRFP